VYSQEGNALVEHLVEPFRKAFLARASRRTVAAVSAFLTAPLFLLAHTLYRLPFRSLPYSEYLRNARALSWKRNFLNVFDKLNAPQVQLISRSRAEKWIDPARFEGRQLTSYCGVSWRVHGRLKDS
jgi:hypothetical protein